MKKLKRSKHTDKDNNGLYRVTALCDGCNRPVGTSYFTDEEVCGGGDGPGFYVCDRTHCQKKFIGKTPEERKAIYVSVCGDRKPGDPFGFKRRKEDPK